MKSKTSLTKAELLRIVKIYSNALFNIKDYCDNPQQFKDREYVRDLSDCYACVVGAIGYEADYALGLYD